MKTKSNIGKLREAIRAMVLAEVKSLKQEDISDLPKVSIPANVNTKLQLALTQIRDAKLSFNQKIQLVGMVIDSLGIDKSELSKIDTKIKSVMGGTNDYAAGAADYKTKYEGKQSTKQAVNEARQIPIEKVKVGQEVMYRNDMNAVPFVVKTIEKSHSDGKEYIILKGSKGTQVLKRIKGNPVLLLSETTKLKESKHKSMLKEGSDWILLPSINKMVDSYEGHFYDAKNPMFGEEVLYNTSKWKQLYKKLKGDDKETVDSIVKELR